MARQVGMMKLLTLALLALLPLHATAQVQPLTPPQRQAVYLALDDEYHALTFYQAVIAKFGRQKPFSNIVKAEQTHADRLISVLAAAGAEVPANPYANGDKPLAVLPATRAEACALGVQAEIANVALYDDRLLPVAAGNAELTKVFTVLRDASLERHLPAFQRCAK